MFKPKLPCNIELLNINENKSYVINPLNILASSQILILSE